MKRQNKAFANKCRKILLRLLFAVIIVLLLLLLFGYMQDLFDKFDILIKKVEQQTTQIHMLEQEVYQLETENARLENVVVYQHEQMADLREQVHNVKVEGNTMTVDLRPKEMTVEDIRNEVGIHKEEEFNVVSNPQTIIVTTLVAIGGLLRTLIPAIP